MQECPHSASSTLECGDDTVRGTGGHSANQERADSTPDVVFCTAGGATHARLDSAENEKNDSCDEIVSEKRS
jgi:hypothetical protein